MLKHFKKTISIDNLKARAKSGQIATFLILMIVAALVFILVTVNLGQLSVTATNLSNAADSAVLSLASQLATRANMTYKGLGGLKKCKKSGLLSMGLAAVFAIVAYCIPGGQGIGTIMIAGAIGGAVGNVAVQGTCTWNTALQGGLQGAAVGAAVAGGVSMMGHLTAGSGSVVGSGAKAVGTDTMIMTAGPEGPVFTTLVVGEVVPPGAVIVEGSVVMGNTIATAGSVTASKGIAGGGAVVATPTLEGFNISTIAAGQQVPAGSTILSGLATTPSPLGAVTGATLAAGSELYSGYIGEKAQSTAFSIAATSLSRLNEYDRIRESVFLQMFSQTIDDPEKVIDKDDLDGDGETDDEIVRFYKWWNQRTETLEEVTPKIKAAVNKFFDGPLLNFRNFAEKQYTENCYYASSGYEYSSEKVCVPGALSRSEVEGKNGAITELFKAPGLDGFGIWKPGPNKQEFAQMADCECEDEDDDSCCSYPAGYDEADAITAELMEFVAFVDEARALDRNQLTSTWQSWLKWFYDPEEDSGDDGRSGAYYDSFGDMIYLEEVNEQGELVVSGLRDWRGRIEQKREELPDCIYRKEYTEYSPGYDLYATNYPCKDYSRGFFATIDADVEGEKDDEFAEAINAIKELISEIEGFQADIKDFKAGIDKIYEEAELDAHGGLNPVTYEWDDSRGKHKVIAETGPYKTARVKKKRYGGWLKGKICLYLRDYADDGSRTWVRLTRKDPAESAVGTIGAWNAYDNYDPYDDISREKGESDGFFSVSKVSRARYKYAGDANAEVALVRW